MNYQKLAARRIMRAVFAVFLVLLTAACAQYAIFDEIADEIKPKPAKIPGSLSKIVGQGGQLFVANGSLWRYSGGNWEKDGRAPSGVHAVAQNGSLILVPDTGQVWGGGWGNWTREDTSWPGRIAGIFDGPVYNSVDSSGAYYVSGVASLRQVINDRSASYFATPGGLYGSAGNLVLGGYNFTGVLDGTPLGSVAVASSGHVSINGGSPVSLGRSFTGALAVDSRGVLAGLSLGYCIIKQSGGSLTTETPGDKSYSSTIGRVRVTSLGVAGDVIFAAVISSTPERSGLMSFRNGEWNME